MAGTYLARVDMSLLMPELVRAAVDLFDQLANSKGIAYRAYLGYRSFREQQQLYENFLKGGPRAASPWSSAHQWGLAIDVQAYCPGPTWEDYAYKPLWDALANHPILRSGHSFADGDHIELRHPDGPWTGARLAVLPRVPAAGLLSAWDQVRTIVQPQAPGTLSAPTASDS